MLPLPPLWVQRSQHLGKHADPILVWCYFTIYAAGTTSYQQWVNLSCSLWFFIECSHNYLGSRVQEVIFFASHIDSQYMIYQLLGFNLIPTHLIFRDHDLNHSIRSGFCLITRSIFGEMIRTWCFCLLYVLHIVRSVFCLDMIINTTYIILIPQTLKYFCVNHGNQMFFFFEIIINVLVSSFCLPMLYESTIIIDILLFQCGDRL